MNKMMTTKVFLFSVILILFSNPVFAFDRISCDGNLLDWSVWNGFGKKNKVIYAFRPTVELAEKDSRVLVVKDANGKSILEVYPWDGIDVSIVSKSEKFKFDSDKISWFELTFLGDPQRKLLCRLSF